MREPDDIDTNSKKLLELLDKGISDDVSLQVLSNVLNDMKKIYDEETNHYYLTDFHMKNSKAGLKANEEWQKHFPLSREEVFEQAVEYAELQQALKSEDENVAREARIARDELNEQMENDIENYARAKGIWIDNTNETLRERYGDRLASGGEGVVYFDEANGRVIYTITA